MTSQFDWDAFEALPVVGILRGFDAVQVERLVAAAVAGGLRNIEVTMNSPGAPDLIRRARAVADGLLGSGATKMNVGAGTVCDRAQLDAALAAGAEFIVTPAPFPAVIRACVELAIPVFPGAFTPWEVYQAWELGAPVIKLFPADHLGPAFVQALQGPFPQIPLMPTGGITLDSLPAWLRAGASAVGVASPLFNRQKVNVGDWEWVTAQCRAFGEVYQKVRVA